MIFGAVALTGVLAAVSMQTLQGPVTTITRVTQRNIADTQMLMDARIIINGAIAGTAGGDADGDGIIEPTPFVAAAGGETPPTNGGYLPTSLGLSLTDPWGSKYGYCVWDHGTTNSSTDRINGDNTATASQQPVIAIIAAGPDKVFQTACPTYSGTVMDVSRGGDDLVQKFTYAEASANSNGLWTLNESDQTRAELKDSGGTANVSIDRSTGIGDFLGITTDTISAKAAIITIGGGLKLDTEGTVTECAAPEDAGTMRYNSATAKLEYCDGAAWKVAGGTPDATFITQTPSADLSAEQALSALSTGIMKVTTGTGVVSSGAVDLSGTEATGILAAGRFPALTGEVTTSEGSLSTTIADDILDFTEFKDAMTLDASTDIAVTGTNFLSITNVGTGDTLVINDEVSDATPFVIDADGKVGIGTASPLVALHVIGSAIIDTASTVDTALTVRSGDPIAFINLKDDTQSASTGVGGRGNKLELWTNGGPKVYLDETGNLGIGVTGPAAKLDVAGAIKLGSQAACDAGGANNGTVRYDSATKKFQLCVDGVWGSISSIDQLDDIGDVDASAPNDNEILAWDDATSTWKAKNVNVVGSAIATPGGTNGEVQYNDGGTLAGAAQMVWDKTANSLAIGTTSSAAASSLLDLTSTSKGFLPPRMTTTQRTAISSPATGLVVYDTDLNSLYLKTASAWSALTNGSAVDFRVGNTYLLGPINIHETTPTYTAAIPVSLPNNSWAVILNVRYFHAGDADHGYLSFLAYQEGTTEDDFKTSYYSRHYNDYYNTDWIQLLVPWRPSLGSNNLKIQVTSSYNTNASNAYYISYGGYLAGGGGSDGGGSSQWADVTGGLSYSSGGAAVGAGSIDASAVLQADSTTKGFLPPRMTTAQRDAISSPAEGLVAYDTTTHALTIYTGGGWASVGSGSDTLSALSCAAGEVAQWNGSAWICAATGALSGINYRLDETGWANTGAILPGNLGYSQTAVIGDYVYLFGGYNGSAGVNVIYRAPVSNPTAWVNTGATLPGNLYTSHVAVIGDYVYLFGGYNGSAALNVIYRAPVSNPTAWGNTGTTIPGNLRSSQVAVIGDYVYLFGGYNNGAYTNVIYRAPVSDPTAWTNTGATLPGNLGYSQVAAIGDYVYLFGGYNASAGVNVIYRAPVSDPTSWTNTGATIPGILYASQVAVIGDYVYLFGGHNGSAFVNVIYRAGTGLAIRQGAPVALGSNFSWKVMYGASTGAVQDPRIGTLTNSKWCAANAGGTGLDCTQDAPSSVSGSDKQVQFNDGGTAQEGAAQLIWDKTANSLAVGTTSSADASSVVDLTSTSKGFLPPRMTTAQRNAIGSPATGLMIFNTTTGMHETWNGSAWAVLGYGVPAGTIAAFAGACPTGWTEYVAARGRFLRGIDNGAGNDPDGTRTPGNVQGDALQNITGQFTAYTWSTGAASGAFSGSTSNANQLAAGSSSGFNFDTFSFDASRVARTSTETRPKNVAVTFCQYTGSGGGGGSGATASGAAGAVQFSGGSGALASDETNLFWDSTNHFLGIGTDSPATKLHINSSDYGAIMLGDNDSGGFLITKESSNDSFDIWSGPVGIGPLRFTILNNGNVGIGTTSPGQKLHVEGGVQVGSSSTDVYGYHFNDVGSGAYAIEAHNAANSVKKNIILNAWGGNVGIGTDSPSFKLDVAGQARFTGGYTTSDRRWKQNIVPLKDGLSIVEKLQGVGFDWRRKEFPKMNFAEGRQFGFIAQDVEKVLPEIVSTDKAGYKNISYESITPFLVEAAKGLKADNDNLRAELKAANENQAAEIRALREEIEAMKAKMEAGR